MSPPRRSWKWIVGVSALVGLLATSAGMFVSLSPLSLLAALFGVGGLAGALSTRQAWLSGILVGLPLSLEQLTRWSLCEFGTHSVALGQPDYWWVAVPVSFVATGVAILGALTGAWLFGARFR